MSYPCRRELPVLLIHNIDPAWPPQEILDYQTETKLMREGLIELGHPLEEVCIQDKDLAGSLRRYQPDEHVVFNWCEELPGVTHSEYKVAEILDEMGFTYTGSDTQALMLSQDKRQIKQILQREGIPTPSWQVLTSSQGAQWGRYPAIVKPAFEHCGYGIARESVVQTDAELRQRIDFVINELAQPAIVEDFIDGREFHVGVIGNGELTMLPPAEIDYSPFEDIHDRLCTYESNFDKDSLAYQLTLPKLPVDFNEAELRQLEGAVLGAYKATNCRDYARMDVRLRQGIFYILDVNHNADISSDTSLVLAAGLLGFSYGQLGSLFVNLAAQRHPVLAHNFIGEER